MLLFVSPEQEPVQSTAPLFTERCPAGFPSLAADYTEEELGLHSGDLMIVDKAEKPQQGDIVIAETDGELAVKRLQLKPRVALLPMNPAYPTLYTGELQIFGVVTAFIHKTRGLD